MKKSEKGGTTEEDVHLIQKITQRDSVAFGAFYDGSAKMVFTFLSRLLKNRVESEDLLQETFWQAWRQVTTYDSSLASPMVWVLTIAKEKGLNRLKHLSISPKDNPPAEEISIDPDFLITLSLIVPPPSVRANLLNTIEQEKKLTPRLPCVPPIKRNYFYRWLTIIGWVISGILGAILFTSINTDWQTASHLNTEISSLNLTLSEQEEVLIALRQALAERERSLALMEAQETVTAVLTGYPALPNTLGKVFWNPKMNTGFFVAFDLPLPPNGKVYQLWAGQEETSADAGVFSFPMKTGSFKIKPILNPSNPVLFFTVTAEPIGGSSQPTGAILLKSG